MSLIGRQLGDFLLDKKLGAGGMGEVYRARQISLDRIVAVKVLPRSLSNQEGFEERFRREARAAANLIHPNVIQVYHIGIDHESGSPYFAMEYVEGEDLQQRMQRLGRMPFEHVIELMCGVASALSCAFEKGIVHRDIKPSNIMIDKNEIVKVMDFGLAKAMQDKSGSNLTQSGIIMGTPNYISPEAGRGDPIDSRSDIYSLGVVFYELLSGALPFTANTPAAIIYKHVYEPPPPPRSVSADIPPFLEDICLHMIAKEPKDRYPNAKALLADLNEFKRNTDYYMKGGARRVPAVMSGSVAGDSTMAASGQFPARAGPGSRTGVETQNFKASATAAETQALTGATPVGSTSAILGGTRGPLAAALIIAGVIGIGAVGFILIGPLFTRQQTPVQSGFVQGSTTIPTASSVAPPAGTVSFPASRLPAVLPKNVETAIVRGFEQPQTIAYVDTNVPPGDYQLVFKKPGFQPIYQTFRLSAEGISPPIESLRLEFKPLDELKRKVETARRAIDDGRYKSAIRELQEIVDTSPDYEAAAAALGDAKRRQGEVGADFQRAQSAYNQHRWAQAIESFRKLPTNYEEGDVVQQQIRNAETSISLLKEHRENFDHQLTDGDYAEAKGKLLEMEKLMPVEDVELKALRDKVADAGKAFDAGRSENAAGQYQAALSHFETVLNISPNHREAIRLAGSARAELDRRRGATEQLDGAITAGEKAFTQGQFEVAAAEAARALGIDPSNKSALGLAERAKRKIAEEQIVRRFSALDEDFRSLDFRSKDKRASSLLEKVDPAATAALKADLEAFSISIIEVKEAEHKDFAVELSVGPAGETAAVLCSWNLTLGFPEAEGAVPPARGRVTAISVRQRVGLKRAGNAWVFTSFEQVGNANVTAK